MIKTNAHRVFTIPFFCVGTPGFRDDLLWKLLESMIHPEGR